MRLTTAVASLLLLTACGEQQPAPQSTRVQPNHEPAKATIEPAKATIEPAPEPDDFSAFQTIEFPATDGLSITADLYVHHPLSAPFILLFHQAGWSRGEYLEIAPQLGRLGFNCLAIDQRSGGKVNQVDNQTHQRATAEKRGTAFLDARSDMRDALNFVKKRFPKARRIAWGSSYSASLVLKLAGEEPELMSAALAFSPGEYFTRFGKSKNFIADAAKKIQMPVFITSAAKEKESWRAIYKAIPSRRKYSFVPTTKGNHGSRALWRIHDDSEQYWDATRNFLSILH